MDEFELNQEIQIRMHKEGNIYYFNTSIVKYDLGLKEICIRKPEQIKINHSRKNKRYKFENKIKIAGSNNFHFGESFDISRSGMGFYSSKFFYTGDILFVSFFDLTEGKKYELEVVVKNLYVANEELIRYGVEFADWVNDELDDLIISLEKREKIRSKKNEKIERKEEKSLKKGLLRKLFFKRV